MVTDGPPVNDTLSITSGYSVPCARNAAPPTFLASASNTSMNSLPMIRRFSSGSDLPASASMKVSDASTLTSGML
jgi:hypothetical protein